MPARQTTQRQAIFWIAVFLGLGIFLYLLSDILLPFVLGMAIAYFLDPVVGWLERRGSSRAIAASGILVGFFLVGVLILLLILPVIVEQVVGLSQRLPQWISWTRQSLVPVIDRYLTRVGAPPLLTGG